jgi:hypothetical protein
MLPVMLLVFASGASSAAQSGLSIDPDSITFQPTVVGDYSYEMATITNAGPEDDTIVGVLPQGESLFPTQAGTCNLQNWLIPAGTSCTYQFGFHPDRPGRVRNTITLYFGSGATLDVTLTGRGRPH